MQDLPLDCEVSWEPEFLVPSEAGALFEELVSSYDLSTKMPIVMADGTTVEPENASYFFMDPELTSYEIFPECWGGRSPWPDSLAAVRERIEAATGTRFQVARCVYYRNGSEGMAFHSDPSAYGSTNSIASLSLGAEREFVLRRVDDPTDQLSLMLPPGSLLHMGMHCQERYEHGVPSCEECMAPRLNITFRRYGWD